MSIKKKLWRYGKEKAVLCIALMLALLTLTGFGSMRHVKILADGCSMEINTIYATPERILHQAGVTLQDKDEYRLSTENVQDHTTIIVYRAVPVTVEYQGKKQEIVTSKPTVGDVLNELGYSGDAYVALPDKNTTIQRNLNIQVQDVVNNETEEQKASGNETNTQGNPDDMQAAMRNIVETSRGARRFSNVLYMEATAYLPSDGGGSGITASGAPARYGVVSVDPDVIPLGTRLFIPGYGMAVAADTGGAIVGERIDLCMDDYTDAMDFGRREVKVYILD
jgi:3D (Asp-Asp-Asp) domain-containing protein